MRQLIINVKAALSGVLPDLRDRDIVLLPEADLLPEGVRLPCIGIKDGRTDFHELAAEALEVDLQLEVYLFDRLIPGDDCILDFLAQGDLVYNRLKGNLLSGYVREVSPVSATPIFLTYSKKGSILRKGFFFQYEREE